MEVQPIEDILDAIVADFAKEAPEVPEFEAAFTAVQMNLAVMVQAMSMIGMRGEGLTSQELFHFCTKLVETAQWMTAKLYASDTVREFNEKGEV